MRLTCWEGQQGFRPAYARRPAPFRRYWRGTAAWAQPRSPWRRRHRSQWPSTWLHAWRGERWGRGRRSGEGRRLKERRWSRRSASGGCAQVEQQARSGVRGETVRCGSGRAPGGIKLETTPAPEVEARWATTTRAGGRRRGRGVVGGQAAAAASRVRAEQSRWCACGAGSAVQCRMSLGQM